MNAVLYRFLRRRHLEDLRGARNVLPRIAEHTTLYATLNKLKRELQISLMDIRRIYYGGEHEV